MADKKKLLEWRRQLKKKKPEFIREDSHQKTRVHPSWRNPDGDHSKMRHMFRGYKKGPSQGYRSPRLIRGFSRSGLKQVVVQSMTDISRIDPHDKELGIIIGGNVGTRKKVLLLKKCLELKLNILNFKDAQNYIKNVEEKLKENKTKSAEKKKEKDKKKEEREKAAEEKKKKEAVQEKEAKTKSPGSSDDLAEKIEKEEDAKKEAEKKEKDKVLTKRS